MLDVLFDVVEVIVHYKLNRQDRSESVVLVFDLHLLNLVQPLFEVVDIPHTLTFSLNMHRLLESFCRLYKDLDEVK